jgi:pimeloyl-ACP methyl ester carboxylesterase
VLQRVDEALSSDTEVLIGHSLGSVIAYEYLCEFHPESVKMLVTLGSPLGIQNLIFHRLTPPPVEGKGQWPGAVTWVNVADLNDKVALCKELADLYPGPQSNVVDDRLVDNGNKPHDIVRYLNSAQTGSALYDTLR